MSRSEPMDDGADDSLAGGDVTTIRTATRALGESVRAGQSVVAMGSRRVRASIAQCRRHVARAVANLVAAIANIAGQARRIVDPVGKLCQITSPAK